MGQARAIAFCLVCIAFVAVGSPAAARAAGFGAYVEYARGRQTIDYERIEEDFSNDRLGVGLVADNNLSRDHGLNVRASLGYLMTRNTVEDEAHGGAVDVSLGYGFLRTPRWRLWVGPVARFQVDVYENDDADVTDLSVGGGVRLGVNWHPSPRLSLAPSLAYQFLHVRETIEDDLGKDHFDGYEHLVVLRLSVLFRSAGDVFTRVVEAP